MIRPVPELADGGYWYVAPLAESGDQPAFDGVEHIAQYGAVSGSTFAILRTVVPITSPRAPVTVADVLAAATAAGSLPEGAKFYARLRGR